MPLNKKGKNYEVHEGKYGKKREADLHASKTKVK